MLTFLVVFATGIGTGLASTFIPIVNAEIAVAAGAGYASIPLALGWVTGIAVGQTVGKIIWYETSRAGKSLFDWHRRPKSTTSRPVPAAAPLVQSSRWRQLRDRINTFNRRLLDTLDQPRRRDSILFLSAVAGVPPLIATATMAGILHFPRRNFILEVASGRLIRFFIIATPFLIALH
jgi:membrane protein YqaA with SNARE-associated domain